MTLIKWSGDDRMRANMQAYGDRVRFAVEQVAKYWSAVLEKYAKEQATWTDRTANARQSLRGYVSTEAPSGYPNPRDLARHTVAIYLSHGVHYGIFLETRFQGQYAIIAPTLQAHYGKIAVMLRGIFGR